MSHKRHNNKGAPQRQNPASLWTDLNDIYARCVEMSQVPGQVSIILRNKELVQEIGDTTELERHAKRMVHDIKEFKASLEAIHARHIDKTGECKRPDDWMEAINIHEGYLSWIESYQNSVHPTLTRILEISGKAEEALQARKKAEQTTSTQDSLASQGVDHD